jgi:hypothetical protein
VECFAGARLKVARAAEHLARLDAAAAEYLNGDPFTLRYRYDVGTAEHVILLEDLTLPNPSIALTTGEFVQALRTALDYVAAALIECATGASPPLDSKFEFPIFLDSKAYEARSERSSRALTRRMLLSSIRFNRLLLLSRKSIRSGCFTASTSQTSIGTFTWLRALSGRLEFSMLVLAVRELSVLKKGGSKTRFDSRCLRGQSCCVTDPRARFREK